MKTRQFTGVAILLAATAFSSPATSADELRPPNLERCERSTCPDRRIRISAELLPGLSFDELVHALEGRDTHRASRRSSGKIRFFGSKYKLKRSLRSHRVTGRNNLLRIRVF